MSGIGGEGQVFRDMYSALQGIKGDSLNTPGSTEIEGKITALVKDLLHPEQVDADSGNKALMAKGIMVMYDKGIGKDSSVRGVFEKIMASVDASTVGTSISGKLFSRERRFSRIVNNEFRKTASRLEKEAIGDEKLVSAVRGNRAV